MIGKNNKYLINNWQQQIKCSVCFEPISVLSCITLEYVNFLNQCVETFNFSTLKKKRVGICASCFETISNIFPSQLSSSKKCCKKFNSSLEDYYVLSFETYDDFYCQKFCVSCWHKFAGKQWMFRQ